MSENKEKSVCIVVLGDVGRSPRMQYHALSLARHGYRVDVIGYGDTGPISELRAAPQVQFHYLIPYVNLPVIKTLNYLFKVVWQVLTLTFLLAIIKRPATVLVQNPPAVPSLLVTWLYCKVTRAKFVIDWHNYASTIMAMSVGEHSPLVSITKRIEHYCGRRADGNFCVTKTMRDDLRTIGIKATVLYDRPPRIFRPLTLTEKHEVLTKLATEYPEFSTFTEIDCKGDVVSKRDRPGFLISSTSWTEDEDFSILLDALQDYEEQCTKDNEKNLPKLLCVITGKGPLKDYYVSLIEKRTWSNVKIITPWLDSDDYPRLLACADLGISLHTSSSGLDLPMKVIDMFGCGLIVCAANFHCLNELLRDEENGFIFEDSSELAFQIRNWFKDFPNGGDNRKQMEASIRSRLEQFQVERWEGNWDRNALATFA